MENHFGQGANNSIGWGNAHNNNIGFGSFESWSGVTDIKGFEARVLEADGIIEYNNS